MTCRSIFGSLLGRRPPALMAVMVISFLLWCCASVPLGSCSCAEEFLERYQGRGPALLGDFDDDWARRTAEYGVHRPTRAGRVFVYRAFDYWSNVGPFYRATTEVYPTMHPDELLTRVALHWPDLGNQWNHVDWRLTPVNEARIASCLHDLLFSTYVLIMPGLLRDLSHRPHGLLEIAHGDTCHVRATVLPPRINLPILQDILSTLVRCTGMHNGVALTDELQDCSPGFFVQIFVAGVKPKSHIKDFRRSSVNRRGTFKHRQHIGSARVITCLHIVNGRVDMTKMQIASTQ